MKDPKDMSPEEIKAFVESLSKKGGNGGNSTSSVPGAPSKIQKFRATTKLLRDDVRHIIWAIARDVTQFIGFYEYDKERECPVLPKDYEGYIYADSDIEAQIRENFTCAYPDAIAACIEMCRFEAGVPKAKPTQRGAFFLSLALEWEATPKVIAAQPFYFGLQKSPSPRPTDFFNKDFWLSSKVQAQVVLILVRWAGRGFPSWVRSQRKDMVEFEQRSNRRWR